MYVDVHTTSFNSQKWKPKCPSTGKWLKKSVKERNSTDIYRNMVNLKSIMLSERSQIQNIIYCMIPHM